MLRESAHQVLLGEFAAPKAEFSPTPLWWWSGEKVELHRLCWQLDQLVEAGVRNAVVMNLAPTGPLYGALADEPHLLTDDWWALWEGLCTHAAQRGARLWFYDQLGFSGANLQGRLVAEHAEYAGASIQRIAHDTAGTCVLECPMAGSPIAACAVPIDDAGAAIGAPVPLPITDGRAEWDAAGRRHRVLLAYSLRQGFDYTAPNACAALIDVVHGEFERRLGRYLGHVIVGSFQDELPSLPTWSASYAGEFERRAGYRLEPVIAALWDDWGPESARIRADYQRVRAALAEEAFFKPLHDWHERHAMLCGFDQQGPSRQGEPVGTVRQYADYLRTHRWYTAPGSDHHGEARIHSSLAEHYQRPRVWIESFHSSGWGGTLEETFDWLVPWLLAGATLYNPHAVYYSTRAGWWEWAPPSTCWRQPYWRHYRRLADTVSRLCWLLAQGRHACDVGVLFPTATVQAYSLLSGPLPSAERASAAYVGTVGRMVWYDAHRGALERAGRSFAVLDDDTVAGAEVSDGELRAGVSAYRAMILPSCAVLESATARVLADFGETGGVLVVIGDLPQQATDPTGDEAVRRLRALASAGRLTRVEGPDDLAAALATIPTVVTTDGPVLHRRIGDRHVLLLPAAPDGWATAQPMQTPGTTWKDFLHERGYDFDPGRYRERTTVRIDGAVADVEQWDPLTGTARPVTVHAADGGVKVNVDFESAPVAVLVWHDGPSGSTVKSVAEPQEEQWRELALDDGRPWSTTLVATTDNRYGDLAWPPYNGPVPVQQWRLRHRVEGGGVESGAGEASIEVGAADWQRPDLDDASWPDVLVGQGVWAWQYGPISPSHLPDPLPSTYDGPLGDSTGNGNPGGHGGAGSTRGVGWKPVRYSLSRGIENDPVHVGLLGPKARVPDEFWHVEDVRAGQVVAFRTTLPIDTDTCRSDAAGIETAGIDVARGVTLAVAANGVTEVWWNGAVLGPDPGGFLRLDDVDARAGNNLLEVRVTAEADESLRGYWGVTTDVAAFRRPEWLMPADAGEVGTQVRFQTALAIGDLPATATLQLGTEGPATLWINGREVANQGAFEPYGSQLRVLPYDVAADLQPGENVVEIRVTDVGGPVGAFVDAQFMSPEGTSTTLVTDSTWTAARDGRPAPVALRRSPVADAQWALLRPRPHPLPRAQWIDPAPVPRSDTVVDIVPEARPGQPKPAEWFRCVVPPGAVEVTLPVESTKLRAWLDGAELEVSGGRARLGDPKREHRTLAVRIEPEDGHGEGALWSGPLEFECGEGSLAPGDWSALGLSSYAGGVTYRRTISLAGGACRAVLDLGRVRGTAEVAVNGQPAGTRIWSPYRFDISDALRPGDNEIEVTVLNTLGPYLDAASPTQMVAPGQRVSGLLGPVRLLTTDR